MASLAVFNPSTLCLVGAALAQETPILVAKDLPQINGWCGDDAVYFNANVGGAGGLTLLDVRSGKKLSLEVWSAVMLGCSPDGRWALTLDSGHGTGQGAEGGDPSCDPFINTRLPWLVFWNLESGAHHVVGKGYVDVKWSPDGKVMLYRFRPFCDFESDRRNAFKLPPTIQQFRSFSARTMIATALGSRSGWPDEGRIGAVAWYAPDAFVAQLPAGEGGWLDDTTPAGAIVVVHQRAGKATRIEQLNPTWFQSSWSLTIPQVPSSDSDMILKAAGCTILRAIWKHPSSMGCESPDEIRRTGFQPDLTSYCQSLTAGDIKGFCATVSPKMSWQRIVHGRTVLVVKHGDIQRNASDLFRMERDHGGYLK
jgi:hypothetical protein